MKVHYRVPNNDGGNTKATYKSNEKSGNDLPIPYLLPFTSGSMSVGYGLWAMGYGLGQMHTRRRSRGGCSPKTTLHILNKFSRHLTHAEKVLHGHTAAKVLGTLVPLESAMMPTISGITPHSSPSTKVDDVEVEVGVDEHVGAVLVDHPPPGGTLVHVEPAQLAALDHLHPPRICQAEDSELPVPPQSNPSTLQPPVPGASERVEWWVGTGWSPRAPSQWPPPPAASPGTSSACAGRWRT